jgi:hypothetical protein
MDLKASDVAKLAAGIAAGYFTSSYVSSLIEDEDDGMLEKLIKMGGSAAAGGVVGKATSDLMDATGASDVIDDVADTVSDLFDW